MKKILFSILILSLISTTVFAANLPATTVEKIFPQPVEPGQDLTIDVAFSNTQGSATTFSVREVYEYPFILKSSSETFNNREICNNCVIRNKYFLVIDSKAISGTYPFFIEVFSGSSKETKRVDITVKGTPNVVFTTEKEGLKQIVPDSQFAAILNVKNIGSGEARQIKISTDSTNFVVLGNSVKTIESIKANESFEIEFDFLASADLQATSYTIPFTISYKDDEGKTLNSTQNLGVRVVNKATIDVQTIKVVSNKGSSEIKQNELFTVVARLENTGKGNADTVVANITCPFTEPKKAFIGQLKKDEDAPAVFEFTASSAGSFNCDLAISYKDDLGTYTLNESFPITVSGGDFSSLLILILVILLVVSLFRKRIPYIKKF